MNGNDKSQVVEITVNGLNAVITVDGQEIKGVTKYRVRHSASGMPKLTLSIVPTRFIFKGRRYYFFNDRFFRFKKALFGFRDKL